ncbi:MAG: DNA replication and repair protein RecF [Bacteroidales bacterium]|nr:DNA replication and repair protein RecF [Candidatus Sodaliphilus aphodohippi]
MILNQLSILNYKNIAEAQLRFSPNVNCLIGNNGMGKTNVLDAIYYLSFCKSFGSQTDANTIRHGEQFLMLQGHYTRRNTEEDIVISAQRGKHKVVKRGGKEYQRQSQHIGLLPVVMVSPIDWTLISGASDERRRFMDQIISQGDKQFLDSLIRYNRALEQRNSMLRNQMRDPLLYETVEAAMCQCASYIHNVRRQWVEKFKPIFAEFYAAIAGDGEKVDLRYSSHLNDSTMDELLAQARERDLVLGYTSHGTHRDDLEMMLGTYSMRRTGSQGQGKTFTIALRLAQYEFLRQSTPTTPVLLLDDIFDKLDARRVENIVNIVASDRFGQIFITDTNRTHLDEIMQRLDGDHSMFTVVDGVCTPSDCEEAVRL